MLPKTERQAQVLDFIYSFAVRRGAVPSYATIARYLGVKSRATVHKHIQALERRGLIQREGTRGTFSLRVVFDGVRCPKCNHVFLHQSSSDTVK
jgi:repressor LexA